MIKRISIVISHRLHRGRFLVGLALIFLSSIRGATGELLYATDFSEFDSGEDTLAGIEGWAGDLPGFGLHGIVDSVIPGAGRSAYLGLNHSSQDFVAVWRPLNLDPVGRGTPRIEFSVTIGIVDSTNRAYDNFFVTFLNQADELLASINFDNAKLLVFLDDATTVSNTEFEFVPDTYYNLVVSIDFAANTWSASMDGDSLFESRRFHGGDRALNLGAVAAEWLITDLADPGNNWMVFDDWSVAAPDGPAVLSPRIERIYFESDGALVLEWTGQVGVRYQVHFSDDLLTWRTDLPNSTFEETTPETGIRFRDETAASTEGQRFYRLTAEAAR